MNIKVIGMVIAIFFITISASTGFAEVAWEIQESLNLKKTPRDMKISMNGEWIYLLTDSGDLMIYKSSGQLEGEIEVGKQFDQIEPTPDEETLYLKSSKKRIVSRLNLNFVRNINIIGSPFKGLADAPVVLVNYTDFQCPYCSQLAGVLDQVLALYPDKVKIVYKSYPLRSHTFAYKAAIAAMAAHEKGKFWEFHDRLFENFNQLSDDKLFEIRKTLGLATPEFDQTMNSITVRNKVRDDAFEGSRIGVKGTPTLYINGKRLKDKRLEGLKAAIEKELNK